MIDSDASKQKKYKDFTLSQATQSLIRQRKTVNLFKTNLLTLISHKLVRMQQRSSMVFEKDNEEDQSLGKLTSQEFNHGDEFINCEFGQKQESTDNTHPLFLKSKLFDAKLIKCKYNQQNSVVVILKNVSYKIRHQRDTEMKNVRNKVFQTITHNLKTPLNGIMTILESQQINTQKQFQDGGVLQTIHINSLLLEYQISDMLDFISLSGGNFKLNLCICNLKDVLNTI